ncbi:hypothetical protein B0I37DRAFT_386319 [Chaetomium sp. MPI-CAGE-AT-0009]|nr:hypothetical protein B0I37DRAFT_386319 [Chaetomium sp. MPI-CAGE-AT-0009]
MGQHECSRALFFKEGVELSIMRPNLTFTVGKENLERATTGFIASATCPLVKTAAASGWQANPVKGQNVLDNSKYLRLVREMAGVLKFTLTRSPRDNNGRPQPEHSGRFVASHAEKKLAVFWVIAVLKAVLGSTDLKRVHDLRGIPIPGPFKEAWVFLDHTPCENCWEFLERIKQATGISIYVETRPFLTKKNRQDVVGCRKCACARCKRRFGAEQARDTQLDPERCDDDTELGPESSEGDTANLEHGANIALQEEGGEEDHQRRARETTRPEAMPVISSRAPEDWTEFADESGFTYAKPIRRSVRANPIPGLDQASTPPPREPISTIAGRSGFFASPDPRASIEVHIPRMSTRVRAEYDRVSNVSGTLDLGRFAYIPPTTTTSAPRKATRQRRPQKPVAGSKSAKVAAPRDKSRTRVSKPERTRVRSAFARAVEHHQRRRAGKA